MIKSTLIRLGDTANVVAVVDGEMYQADNEHPNWDRILRALENNDPSVVDLFDVSATVAERFNKVSERVSIAGGTVYFDGEPVNNTLTRQVLRFLDEGVDFSPLVKFFEKVQTNPNEHSREQLYSWLEASDFTIDSDGDIRGYKGVIKVNDNEFTSISHGRAIVDGVVHEGAIPNAVGSVVEMPRGDVQHDPSVGCHTGLHVGTWDYASSFARGAVLEVKVNPRDVVSVPTDCNAQKMRTCRYTVVSVTDQPYSTAYAGDEVDYSEEYFDGESEDDVYSVPEPEYDEFFPDSDVIDAVSWADGDMTVTIYDGREYVYPNVPYSVFNEFSEAESAGRFWTHRIQGNY